MSTAHKDEIQEVLRLLNSYDRNIRFTMENENNMSIPFLDIKLHRDGNNVVTDWYKKDYASDRISYFLSCHSYHMHMNTEMGLIKRITTLSDKRFEDQDLSSIKNRL